MPDKTEVFSENRRFFLPEVRVEKRDASHRYMPLRGHGYTLAVFDGENPIGYIMCDTLGFEHVRDMVKANHPQLMEG